MPKPSPTSFAVCVLAIVLPGCVALGPKPIASEPRTPVVEIRHAEALNEQIRPQARLLLALKLGNLLDSRGTAALEAEVMNRLAAYPTSVVFLDLSRGEQPDLRRLALEKQAPYVVTLFAGTDVVLQGHGALAPNEMIANLFDARSATPLWASLMRLGEEDAQAPSSVVAGAIAATVVDELSRIGALASEAAMPAGGTAAAQPSLVLALRQAGAKTAPWSVALGLMHDGESAVFALEGSVPLSASHMVLQRPERLVIDLAGVELVREGVLAAAQEIEGSPLVTRMRASQYQKGVVRLVLDLKRSVEVGVLPRTVTQAGTMIESVSLRPM